MNITFDLNTIWFFLVGMLFTGYAILDGFDLGVGALHLLTKTDKERRIMINSIGPVWDGNEVWLVTGGGALFAAFPMAYATVFSGFYIAFMIFLFGLIFRAVAIEFRSKQPMGWWRQMWDVSFSLSSILSAFIAGVALGNLIIGIPLDSDFEFVGSFWSLLRPYPIIVGITTVAVFMMHGAIYVVMKTEGELHDKIRGWINNTIIFFILCYVTTTMITLIYIPHMLGYFKQYPPLFILPFLNMLAIANIPREVLRGNDFRAFLSSCAAIAALLAIFGMGMFPNIVYSNPIPANSLTIYNAASSPTTHEIMLIIAIIGIPLVISYTVSIYWIFRGKVKLDSASY
ncbi:cytochrome d ubiquinol oxidase subunit II [candidate division KSB1 bacterium]|nr:cytochrome d ubiquinol oxidase subunit II [candidate division KSB1 bacterium]